MRRCWKLLVAGCALATPLATGCGPQPPPIAGPAVGCHDGGGADVNYLGPANTLDNAELHSTDDGTCGGAVVLEAFVVATTQANADAMCASLGGTTANGPLTKAGLDYPTLVNTWECSGLVSLP